MDGAECALLDSNQTQAERSCGQPIYSIRGCWRVNNITAEADICTPKPLLLKGFTLSAGHG